ncbi:MAG TPA: hypothetical protein VHX61_15525 [Rhizomicrobium sp.]|jgi:hypothetical protein|nr:hypothetical protein [Rhizomicrobium sp.]
MIEASSSPSDDNEPRGRWPFIRDVLVLQLKLLMGNLHNFVLIPATMGAAALDLVFKSGRHGARFYRVLDWGRRAEEAINLYGALDRRDGELKRDFTVDTVVSRLEDVIIRVYENGGTAANLKAAVDQVLDRLHEKSDQASERTHQAAQQGLDKVKPPDGEA